jgi:starch synthase
MRVAFLSFVFEEYCIRLANALAQQAEILLLLPTDRAEAHLGTLDPAVQFQPFAQPRLRQPLRQIRMINTIHDHIRRFDPDVIHFQQGHLWFNLGLPLLRRYPLVLTIHDPRYHLGDRESQKTPQALMDFGFHRASQVIVHGQQLKRVVVDQLGVADQVVHVIPPVPDITLEAAAPEPTAQEDERLVLFFGRIWEYKGLEYLIRAEPAITAQAPDAKIVIAGQGEDFARYRRLMVHPERFVVHNEYISNAKREELFRRASVVVLPYIDASLSGVIPVAYTFSKPVVATTVGVLPEMVEHGRTGYVVPPRDPSALAGAIVQLLQDPQLRQQFGANARRKLTTDFSPAAVSRQMLEVYHCAIKSQPKRARRKE